MQGRGRTAQTPTLEDDMPEPEDAVRAKRNSIAACAGVATVRLELDVKLEQAAQWLGRLYECSIWFLCGLTQDGNFFLAKPTRFRPLGCFLRLPGQSPSGFCATPAPAASGGREGFLPVEHITPRAEASTNGVRSTVGALGLVFGR